MFWSRLQKRCLQPELMDDPALDAEQHRQALRGLERINRWSGSARVLWPALAELACRGAPRPCRILDVASGGGDVLRGLWRRANRAGLPFRLEGCDVSSVALAHAQEKARQTGAIIHFFQCNALADGLPGGYDAVVCSLFLHHLDEERAVLLLERMRAAAERLVLVNDLERRRLGYVLAWVGSRVLTRSRVVHVDGPRSVEGAFTREEALELARRAGLSGATIARRWPCRFLLSWERREP